MIQKERHLNFNNTAPVVRLSIITITTTITL